MGEPFTDHGDGSYTATRDDGAKVRILTVTAKCPDCGQEIVRHHCEPAPSDKEPDA